MKTKQLLLTLLMLTLAMALKSQITFVINQLPDYTPENDQIYIALNYDNFTNGNPEYALYKNQEGKWEIIVNPPSTYQNFHYYFNRGTWSTRETDALEYLTNPRRYNVGTSKSVKIIINNWYDHENRPSTAASNVKLISRTFPMPQLGLDCFLYIYLPPDYDVSGKSYPVMYAHDGLELFDNYESPAKNEIKVDETLNDLAAEGFEVPIVVAIDNLTDRNYIYSPWDYASGGVSRKGTGKKYIDFLTNTLKPYIDSAYRTLPGRENTYILGASLGGLISYYGAIRRPDVFGKAGLFSPSYWVSDSVWTLIRDAEKVHPMRLYQLVGSKEGALMVNGVIRMNGVLGDLGFPEDEFTSKIVEGGEHNNQLWRSQIREAYLWLSQQKTSSKGKGIILNELKVFPNPATNTLNIDTPLPANDLSIRIFNISGAEVGSSGRLSGNQIPIGNLEKGIYILRITGSEINYVGRFIKE